MATLLIRRLACNTFDAFYPEVDTCGETILHTIALAPQLFLIGCADACAASIFAILSANAIQIL